MEPLWIIGLMSGTSCDGIDGSLLRSDGQQILEYGPNVYLPYSEEMRQRLKQSIGARAVTDEIKELEQDLTKLHAQVVKKLQQATFEKVDLIGFHGQTLFHHPPLTWQIGDGQLLANLTETNVVYNFRQNDVVHGGQGAPLVPIYHQAITQKLTEPCVVVNIGGVANLSYVEANEKLIAFDVGPGGALLDDWVQTYFQVKFDHQGRIGQQGKIHHFLVEKWLEDPFFRTPYPKSLDRDYFQRCINDVQALSPVDGAATLTALTAKAIVDGIKQLPGLPQAIFLSGGGRHNPFLCALIIQGLTEGTQVKLIDSLGLDGDFIESQAFAFLAVRSKFQLPITFPLTTGVGMALSGGQYCEYQV